jgi:hypothetical protein
MQTLQYQARAGRSQDQRDIDRLVNEGGPDPVSSREISRREEVWIETQEQHGGIERLIISLDHETIQRLRQISRHQGVTFETLIGNVLFKYSNDDLVERSLETKLQTPP